MLREVAAQHRGMAVAAVDDQLGRPAGEDRVGLSLLLAQRRVQRPELIGIVIAIDGEAIHPEQVDAHLH